MQNERLRREIVIAAVLFGFGFFILPIAIYWVGRELIGPYSTDPSAGALSLAESVWSDMLGLKLAAWALVLAPYGLVQLLRLARRTWRATPL